MTSERRTLRRIVAGAALAIALGVPAAASAQPSDADRNTARTLMEQGDKAYDAKQYAAALDAYKAADALVPITTTGIWVAKAQVALGQLVEARETAIRVSKIPKAAGESALRRAARAEAEQLVKSLEPRIPSIAVAVDGPSDDASIEVKIDGAILSGADAKQPRKVDPGKHTVSVSAPGFRSVTRDLTVKEGESTPVAIRLERAPDAGAPAGPVAAPASASASASSEAPPVAPPAKDQPSGGISPLVFVGFGAAVIGVGVGAVTGAMALSKASDAKSHCDGKNVCTPEAQDGIDASDTLAIVSDIGFGVGVVGAAVGVVGIVMSGSKPAPSAGFQVRPFVGATRLGVRGSF